MLRVKLSIFHLNIEGGRALPDVIDYITTHNFDIIHLQEVNGGSLSRTGENNFRDLQAATGYKGELEVTSSLKHDPDSFFGNATLYKPALVLSAKKVIWLKKFAKLEKYDQSDVEAIRKFSRNAIALLFETEGKKLWSINTHLAWGPNQHDEPHKIEQGEILYAFLAKLKEPFVLSGDFNVDKDSVTVKKIDTIAVNHAVQAGITNTLNPHLHRAHHLFPPGIAVDFMYTSPTLTVENFSLVDSPDLSDHFGLKINVVF